MVYRVELALLVVLALLAQTTYSARTYKDITELFDHDSDWSSEQKTDTWLRSILDEIEPAILDSLKELFPQGYTNLLVLSYRSNMSTFRYVITAELESNQDKQKHFVQFLAHCPNAPDDFQTELYKTREIQQEDVKKVEFWERRPKTSL